MHGDTTSRAAGRLRGAALAGRDLLREVQLDAVDRLGHLIGPENEIDVDLNQLLRCKIAPPGCL
ncbi:MAG: hypothetical protein LC749_22240 [Actinobacteria bacterium]|nr:hypothetical protein [Actinomycetota bacterium]